MIEIGHIKFQHDSTFSSVVRLLSQNSRFFIHSGCEKESNAGGVVSEWYNTHSQRGEPATITNSEFRFVVSVMSNDYDSRLMRSEAAVNTIADITDVSKKSVHRVKNSLVEKGAITVVPGFSDTGRRVSNTYDFSALIIQCAFWDYVQKNGVVREGIAQAFKAGVFPQEFQKLVDFLAQHMSQHVYQMRINTLQSKQ